MNNSNTEKTVFERIYEQVRKIPKGRVATYGQIALYAGNARWARVADDCKFNHNDTPLFFAAVIGGIGDVTDKKVHSQGISRKTETANLTYALRSGD